MLAPSLGRRNRLGARLRMAPLAMGLAMGLACAAAAAQTVDTSPVAAVPQPAHLPAGWEHGAFMEIFVRGYADSNGDGVGDLRGLISKLDYLKDLGVKGLWLMPITRSADHDHGYATTDFRAVEPAYGSLEDVDELLKQAHRRGMGVVIDYVINHGAAAHPLFQEALKGPSNPYRNWFVWSDTEPQGWDIWGKNPWYHVAAQPWNFKGEWSAMPKPAADAKDFYFGTFGPHMPDFNLRPGPALDYHLSSLRFWLNRGLDGFRLDAVPHMIENDAVRWNDQPESRRLAKQLQDLIKSYPRRYTVCEATAEPQAYGDPAVCGGAFAFGYVHHYVGAARGDADSVAMLAKYFQTASPTMATFVSNHDIFAGRRLWDQVQGDEARYKLAAASYLLQPGTPFIYYGEEVGQAGVPGLSGDQPLRAPMSWAPNPANAGFTSGQPFRPVSPNVATHNAQTQARQPGSVHAFYKAMLALRNRHPSIAQGSFEHAQAQGLTLSWQRRLAAEHTVVAINYGTGLAEMAIPGLPAGARLQPLYPTHALPVRADAQGQAQVRLSAQRVHVYRVLR